MARIANDPRPSRTIASIGAAAVAAIAGGWAFAQPAPWRAQYVPVWLDTYPNSASLDNVLLGTGQRCQLCHEALTGADGWNDYGWNLREFIQTGLTIEQALLLVEGVDSDSDPTASTNLEEIDSDTQPGWTDGPNNTIHFTDGSTQPNQNPPAGILGTLDPLAVAYCFGDGSGTACPCANASAPGAGEGCANTSGLGGLLTASGSASVAADDLACAAEHLLPNQPALLFAGINAVNGGAGNPFGDGLRCAGGSVVRLGIETPNGGGMAAWGPGLGATGGWTAGDKRYLQVWYRDPGGPCAFNFNLSNGLEITFAP